MKKLLLAALCFGFMMSNAAMAQSKLDSRESMDYPVSAEKLWNYLKDFDSLPKWHPAFASDMIISGQNNVVGAVRTLTLKDGPSFDEELLTMDDAGRTFSYRVIDPNPLPIENYVSVLKVTSNGAQSSTAVWTSSYNNKSDGKMTDDDLIKFLNGVYHAGLEYANKSLQRTSF